MHCIKIDPSCLTSKANLDLFISSIKKQPNANIYIAATQNAVTNINTVFQGALLQDSHTYTMLRSIVLEYKAIFGEVENIHEKIETFYQEIESLVKFVEISGECTQNLLNIALERFCRFTVGLFCQYTNNEFQVLQYYIKTGIAEIEFEENSTLILLKNKKHIYNIEKKYIKNPKIVKSLNFKDLMEAPLISFKGLTAREIAVLHSKNCLVKIIEIANEEIEIGEIETEISNNARSDGDIKFASTIEDISVVTILIPMFFKAFILYSPSIFAKK